MYRQQISQKASPSLRSIPTNKEIAPSPSYGSLSSVVQRVQLDPNRVSKDERQQLESAIGSSSTREILAGKQTQWTPEFQGISTQLWGDAGQVGVPIQTKGKDDVGVSEVQSENKTGLPDNLKAGIENLSGMAMDDVRVHYNSSKPAELQALAYTQGTDIHVAPGQEKHLPHEAWHVVQQKQGRVKPMMQMKGVQINDDQGLEREADVMGQEAIQINENEICQVENKEERLSESFIQRKRDDALKAIGANTTDDKLMEMLNNERLNTHYRYTLVLLNNLDLQANDPQYISPEKYPKIKDERQVDDIKKSHYYRHFSNPEYKLDENMAQFEAPRDTILRVLYEQGGFVPLKDEYSDEDTQREFGLSKVVFDTAFEELWKVEKAVQPLRADKEKSQEAGLSLNRQKKFQNSLVSSLGETSDVRRNNTKRRILFSQFVKAMKDIEISVYLTGGAVAGVAYDSPRKIKDLDFKTVSVKKPFNESLDIITEINKKIKEDFSAENVQDFKVNSENVHAIDGKIYGIDITIGRVMNLESYEKAQYKIENDMISGIDLIVDKAATFIMRTADNKKTTDLFDLLWTMNRLKIEPRKMLYLLWEKRNESYKQEIEVKQRTDLAKNVSIEFIGKLADFVARGMDVIHKLFLSYAKDKPAIAIVETELEKLLKAANIQYRKGDDKDSEDLTGKPSLIIQAGNMTGDMFGVSAALIHNPFAHVLVIKESSDRDRSQQIISFYKSSGHEEQVHSMIAEDMSEAYTKYGGRNPEALPYDKISPLIPFYLRSPSKQYSVSEATGQTASFYKKDSIDKMKEKWQVDVKANESSCQKFLEGRKISKNKRYAILWSRFSGKSGGPHAQHDTSFTGMRQMINIAKAGGYIVLITGDRPIKETQKDKYKLMCDNSTVFDLTQFWDDDDWKELFPKGERSEQFNFFEYLNQNGGVKHLGFRSGNLEAYALLGHTVRYMEEEGNLQAGRMEVWHGGQIKYDRIMVKHPPTLTGRYVSDKAKQERMETKPEWITNGEIDKKKKSSIVDYKPELRGFTKADLYKIYKFINEETLKDLLQQLNDGEEISKEDDKIIKPLQEKVTQELIIAAFNQGVSQDSLTKALHEWYKYTELF